MLHRSNPQGRVTTSRTSSGATAAPPAGAPCCHRLRRRDVRSQSSIDDFPGPSGHQPHHAQQRHRAPSRSPSPMPALRHQPNVWGQPSAWGVAPQVWWGSGSHGETGAILDNSNYRSASPSPSNVHNTLDSWDFNDLPTVLPPTTVSSMQPSSSDDAASATTTTTSSHYQQHQLLYPPRPLWTLTDRPGIDLRAAGLKAVSHLSRVYVILFGVGQKDTEGIYSLRAFSEEGLPQETIIVFEAEEDAVRYASLLEATMDHTPSVCSIPPAELLDFCKEAGYQCRLEPEGSLLIPPDFNVSITDWERSLRLREGHFSVLEAEPHGSDSSGAAVKYHPQVSTHAAAWPQDPPASMARYQPSFTDAELAEIRAKLEALLPAEGSGSSSECDD